MKWNKYTLTTTTEAEDLISSMMMDVGIEGIEIEDKIPLSEKDKSQMFVDILPEGPADDGVAKISFYLEPDQDNVEMLAAVQRGLDEIRSWGVDVGAATIEASQTEDVGLSATPARSGTPTASPKPLIMKIAPQIIP